MRYENLPEIDDEKREKEILEFLRTNREAYFRNEPIQQELHDIYARKEAASRPAAGDENGGETAKAESPDNPYNIAAEKFPWLLEAASRRKAEREPVRISQYNLKQQPNAPFPAWNQPSPDFNVAFPDKAEVEQSFKYDQSYGNPSARYFTPGNAMIRTMPIRELQDPRSKEYLERGKEIDGPLTLTDQDISNQVHRGWIGSQRSAVASLGFDLSRTVVAPRENGHAKVLGLYQAPPLGFRKPGETKETSKDFRYDRMWFDVKYPATLVHEAIHRGLAIMSNNGKLPGINLREIVVDEYGNEHTKNELLTRAFMNKFFGDIELAQQGVKEDDLTENDKRRGSGASQILAARKYIKPEELDKIEKAAATFLYDYQRPPGTESGLRRAPRGPR